MMNIKKLISSYTELPKSIYALFFASIINNMGNFVSTLLTMLLTFRYNIGVSMVGTIVAVNSGVGLLGSVLGGKLIDKIGRKKVFSFFRIISAVSTGLCAFTESAHLVIGLLMVSSLAGGVSSPVYSTMIADLTEGEKRNTAYSLEYMAMNLGMAVGPLLAAFLYNSHLYLVFLGDSITTVISVIIVGLLVPETYNRVSVDKKKDNIMEKGESGGLLKALLRRPLLLGFSFIITIYFIVFNQCFFGLSLQVQNCFTIDYAVIYASLMTVNTVMCSVVPLIISPLVRKVHPAFCIVIGGIFYAAGFGMIYFINSYYMFVISAVLWTMGEIFISPNINTYIASHTPVTHRGRFNSIFPIIRKVGSMAGPVIAGFYVTNMGIRNLWVLIFILAITASVLMYFLYRKEICNQDYTESVI